MIPDKDIFGRVLKWRITISSTDMNSSFIITFKNALKNQLSYLMFVLKRREKGEVWFGQPPGRSL